MWTKAALQEAQDQNKPILLSVGYAACHWCHVMAHESFEDADTAAVMNELFVNIKVDREERPDIDHIYMSSLQAFGEGRLAADHVLDSKGGAFLGGTYFPKVEQYGRPAFVTVLRTVAQAFHAEPERIAKNTKIVRDGLLKSAPRGDGGALTLEQLNNLAPQVINFVDQVDGGLRGAPKFPNTPIFELLWRAGARLGKVPYRDSSG